MIVNNKKVTAGTVTKQKLLRGNYNMKSKQKKWNPVIINIMADGSSIDDLKGYVIPAGHTYYDIIRGINKLEARKGA